MNRKANISMTLVVILSFILLSYATLVFSKNVSRETDNLSDFIEVLKLKREVDMGEDFLDEVFLSCFVERYSSILKNGDYMQNPFSYIGNKDFLGLSIIKGEKDLEGVLFSSFEECVSKRVSQGQTSFSGTIELKDYFYLNILDNYLFELEGDFIVISSKEDFFYSRKDFHDRILVNYSWGYFYKFNLNEIGLISFKELENLKSSCGGIDEKDLLQECFYSLNNNFNFELDSFFIGEGDYREEKFVVKLISKKSFYGKKVSFGFILV